MNDFARSFNEAFSSSIERILFISKMSMYMVYSLDDAMKALTAIETFNTKIQSITKQTHLLSLNASIEASRAGREGDGFRIVAHEVKVVSQEIAGLSREMRTKIGLVSSSVRNSYEKLSEVANADMTKNIESREKLDKLLQAMLEQNGRFKDVLDKTAKTSHEISKTIVGTVVGMQFQDRTSQYIHNTVGALSVIGRMIAEQHSFKPEQYEAIADELSRCFLLSEFNNSYAEKLGRKPKQQLVAAASSGTSTDNVELF